MNPPRRRKFTEVFPTFRFQALLTAFHTAVYIRQYFGSKDGRRQTRLFRRQLKRERKKPVEPLKQGTERARGEYSWNRSPGLARRKNFRGSRWDSYKWDDEWDLDAKREELRKNEEAMQEENEALQAIKKEADEDTLQAIEGFKQYIKAHPDSRLAYGSLGTALLKVQDWEASLEAYRKAEYLAGDNGISAGFAKLSIGNVLQQKGDLGAAAEQFRGIIRTAPRALEAHFGIIVTNSAYLRLGNVLNEQGKRRKARAAWNEVLKRDGSGIIAKEALQMLRTCYELGL